MSLAFSQHFSGLSGAGFDTFWRSNRVKMKVNQRRPSEYLFQEHFLSTLLARRRVSTRYLLATTLGSPTYPAPQRRY